MTRYSRPTLFTYSQVLIKLAMSLDAPFIQIIVRKRKKPPQQMPTNPEKTYFKQMRVALDDTDHKAIPSPAISRNMPK